MSLVSATSLRVSPTSPLSVELPSLFCHSAFLISGLTSFTSRLLLDFSKLHHAQCAVNMNLRFSSGGITLRFARWLHCALTLPPFTVHGKLAIGTEFSGPLPSGNTSRLTMLPSAMSCTPAVSSASSPSATVAALHFTSLNRGSLFSCSLRSRSNASVLLGFIIAGIGIPAPAAITVLLFRAPMSLHVLTRLPITAVSFPSIFTVGDVPPVTSPSFFGLFWNLMVPGSCRCIESSCLALLPFSAAFLSPMLTSSESPSSSFPMNGCGSGTVVVLGPDGITIMCTSMPITLSSCAAICFPSAHTPLLPFNFMFFPSMPTFLSHVIFMPLLLFVPVAPSQETDTFFPFSSTLLPDEVLSFLQFIFMFPSSFAIWIPFFLSRTQRIFPAALSMLIPSLPAPSISSRRWALVCHR